MVDCSKGRWCYVQAGLYVKRSAGAISLVPPIVVTPTSTMPGARCMGGVIGTDGSVGSWPGPSSTTAGWPSTVADVAEARSVPWMTIRSPPAVEPHDGESPVIVG